VPGGLQGSVTFSSLCFTKQRVIRTIKSTLRLTCFQQSPPFGKSIIFTQWGYHLVTRKPKTDIAASYIETFQIKLAHFPMRTRSWGSVVGTGTGYGLDGRGVGVQAPIEPRIFSSPRRPDRLWGPPNLLCNGCRELLPRG
jgi:hypothetical protein